MPCRGSDFPAVCSAAFLSPFAHKICQGQLRTSQLHACSRYSRRTSPHAVLKSGDTIAVVGATGRVGRIVVEALLKNSEFRVRAVARSRSKARDYLSIFQSDNLSYAEADVTSGTSGAGESLKKALTGAAAIVIATGTSAFPTSAWGPFFSNSPREVDNRGSDRILASIDNDTLQRIVLITSIGTRRSRQLPFAILNLFGVLDEKRQAELNVAAAAKNRHFDYAIVRPGRLLDESDAKEMVEGANGAVGKKDALRLREGDVLQGQTYRRSVAYVVQCALTRVASGSVDCCMINEEGSQQNESVIHEMLNNIASS